MSDSVITASNKIDPRGTIFELVCSYKTTSDDLWQYVQDHPESINAVNASGETALHVAAFYKMHVQDLLALGFNADALDNVGRTLYDCAQQTFV